MKYELIIALISLVVSFVSLITSVIIGLLTFFQGKNEIYRSKRNQLFKIYNDFLLNLEKEASAPKCKIASLYKDKELDKFYISMAGEANSFSSEYALKKKHQEKLEEYNAKIRDLSNKIQGARPQSKNGKSRGPDLEKLDELIKQIRLLRRDILDEIRKKRFYK